MDWTSDRLTQLVRRAQSGELESLDTLLEASQLPIYRFVRTVLSEESAEDVVQDVLVMIFRKVKWLDDARVYRAWVFQIAWRRAMKAVRRRADMQWNDELEVVLAAPEQLPVDPFLHARLSTALATLSPASRVVVQLHYIEELTIHEIATVLALNPGTVKSRLAYGLSQLRQKASDPGRGKT